MRSVFFNKTDGKLRSGWRAGLFLFTFLFLAYFFILGTLAGLAEIHLGESAESYLPLAVPFAISTALAIILGWLFGKVLEGLPFSALGCSLTLTAAKDLAIGLLVGGVTLAVAVLIAVVAGGMTLTLNSASSSAAITTTLLTALLVLVAGAASEETLFRGYLLQTFTRSALIPIGVGFTSLLFAFAHNANPGANPLALFNTFIAGIWFAAAYLQTRDLWFPFGMHLMWNWLQGPVFGISVSGFSSFAPDPLLKATDSGPVWLTGGTYGIEGGVACTVALTLSIAGIVFFNAKTQRGEVAKDLD
jgi:membrane protease YdiL (CAAX protease family)